MTTAVLLTNNQALIFEERHIEFEPKRDLLWLVNHKGERCESLSLPTVVRVEVECA